MNRLAKEISAEVLELMNRYGFDLGGYPLKALVDYWMQQYPAPWIRLATIEALYQGRYKAISIEQILNLWRRRTRAVYHFNSEFERMISLRPMLGTISLANSASPEASNPAMSSPAVDSSLEPNTASLAASTNEHDYSAIADTTNLDYADYEANLDEPNLESDRPKWQLIMDAIPNSPSLERANSAADSREIRSAGSSEPSPINQFTPTLEASDFYWRLKAVMQAMETGAAAEIGGRN